ncbi:hypothetical protein B0H12DRAFT_1069714 [Mycena haematopus]|nr:hypothetical protein B0H12DRAFT_1069714 [Mycena haematopus]
MGIRRTEKPRPSNFEAVQHRPYGATLWISGRGAIKAPGHLWSNVQSSVAQGNIVTNRRPTQVWVLLGNKLNGNYSSFSPTLHYAYWERSTAAKRQVGPRCYLEQDPMNFANPKSKENIGLIHTRTTRISGRSKIDLIMGSETQEIRSTETGADMSDFGGKYEMQS